MPRQSLPLDPFPWQGWPGISFGHFAPIHVLQAVWMVTWVAVVTLSVDLGLAVGVVFSMMTVVCRTQRWE